MTSRAALVNLAERCETATGFDNALNWEIARACAPDAICQLSDDPEDHTVLSFTSSVDASLRLVPEGHDVQVNLYFGRDGEGAAVVSRLKSVNLPRIFAATPALALCAAALRAKAAEGEE